MVESGHFMCCEQLDIHNIICEWVYLGDGALVFLYSIIYYFLYQKRDSKKGSFYFISLIWCKE